MTPSGGHNGGVLGTALSAFLSPLALLRVPRRTWLLAGVYLALCTVLLGVVRELVVAYQGNFRDLLLFYIFPESWHFAAEILIDRFLEVQQRTVVINAVTAASLVIVTITLFPLKEAVSASFETHGKLTKRNIEELPLWEQAWQEIKLVILFLAAQGTIFWIGYQPDLLWKKTAVVLSYLFIFFAFALDFISPVFQRHLGRYSQIIKTLARNLPASLVFGVIFSLPAIAVGWAWKADPTWSWNKALGLLFGANIISVTWAVLAGTWLGSRMMASFEGVSRSSIATRIVAWVVVLGLVVGNGVAFGALGLSIHHKSQILKSKYDVDLSSFDYELPSLLGVLADEAEVGISFRMKITNPTAFDVSIEGNRLEATHEDKPVAQTSLSPLTIPAGESIETKVALKVKISPSALRKGKDLLRGDAWKLTLYLEIFEGFEMPIYLMGHPSLDEDEKRP